MSWNEGRKREAYYISRETGRFEIIGTVPEDDLTKIGGAFIVEYVPDPVWLMYQDHGNGD